MSEPNNPSIAVVIHRHLIAVEKRFPDHEVQFITLGPEQIEAYDHWCLHDSVLRERNTEENREFIYPVKRQAHPGITIHTAAK